MNSMKTEIHYSPTFDSAQTKFLLALDEVKILPNQMKAQF